MTWNWWGTPGLLVQILAWTAAVIALKTGGQRRTNRQLAVVLFLEGVYGAGNFGLLFFVTSPEAASALARFGAIAMATLPLQYLVFLGVSLRSPLVRPFASPIARRILHAATLVATAVVVMMPGVFITAVFEPGWASWNFTYHRLGPRIIQFHGLVSLIGLVVAIDAYRRAPRNSTARNRAGWFVVAFGLRDAFIAVIQVFMPWLRPIPFWGDLIYNPMHGMMYATYVPLLAYAILRHQLLGIDLRVRFVVKQGSVGAILAGAFLVASEVIESAIPVEGAVLGVVLAVVIAAALKPAQAIAEKIASAAMPNVQPNARYLDERRRVVLRGALENAWADGDLSDKERNLVVMLRRELGISNRDAVSLEDEVLMELDVKPEARAFQAISP